MKYLYIINVIIDVAVAIYTYYVITHIRFYPCIQEKIKDNKHLFSWLIVLCGSVAGFMPYFNFRAFMFGFDNTTIIASILQIFTYIYMIFLLKFTFKTTNSK